MTTASPTTRLSRILLPIIFVAGCQLAGVIGVVTTPTANSEWFISLAKPAFNPPGWLFGPVWTLLYALMGIAAYRIWRIRKTNDQVKYALALFAAQLMLNAAWTPVFFGAHRIDLAAAVIACLLVLILLTTKRFWALDAVAGWLLVPYIVWVAFASALNVSFLILNR